MAVGEQLLKTLKKIDRPGAFCTSGCLPPTLPGLEVAGVGPIALPLTKPQAASLKKQARQAPYGKGTQTLVDTDVRRVWEIDAEQVALANPQWPSVVKQAVGTVQSELGLEKQKLKAHLYKLLLYGLCGRTGTPTANGSAPNSRSASCRPWSARISRRSEIGSPGPST